VAIINDMIEEAKSRGYQDEYAEAYVCQNIVLLAISRSSLSKNVTIKGGVVMRNISNSSRRATQDIDLDFIHYPLSDEAIASFIKRLNCIEEISIEQIGDPEELRHQDYRGKRVYVEIKDKDGEIIRSKIDIGVHNDMSIEQEEYCFDIACFEESANLLINSKEQMFVEKLKSLLKFGENSRRYKDVFDMCYLSPLVDIEKLYDYIDKYIYSNQKMRENNIKDIKIRINQTFSNKQYQDNIERSRRNWIDKPTNQIFTEILKVIDKLGELEQQ